MKTHEHVARAISLKYAISEVKKVEGFNAKLAVLLTRGVGTMACAYLFALISLAGLPSALRPGGEGIVSWIAQTFLQLVLLSVIMVGQSVQAAASDARAEATYNDIVVVLDRLDCETEGGLKAILDRLGKEAT